MLAGITSTTDLATPEGRDLLKDLHDTIKKIEALTADVIVSPYVTRICVLT